MNRVLVVDDDEDICTMIQQYLEIYQYEVVTVNSGNHALRVLPATTYDLIILDVMMPDLDGLGLCSRIRDQVQSPILFLSAKSLEEDKIKALSIGGDDYITKPFSLAELKARIESHIRRDKRMKGSEISSRLVAGRLAIDLEEKILLTPTGSLYLTKKEFQVIKFLVSHKGRTFTKEDLFERIWGNDSTSCYESVTEVIKNIRKKIKKCDPNHNYIKTLYGLGYRWENPV